MFDKIRNKIRNILRCFFAPVAENPLFFIAIVVFSIACVVTEAIAIGNFRKWITAYVVMQSSLWTYMLSWVVYRWDKVWLKAVITSLWGLAALVEVVHYALIEHPVDVQSVSLMLDTNPREVEGFFKQFFTPWVIAGTVAGLLAVAAVSVAVGLSKLKITKGITGLSLITATIMAGGIWRIVHIAPMLTIDNVDDFTVWISQDPGHPQLANFLQMDYADPVTKSAYITKAVSLERAVFRQWASLQPTLFAEEDMVVPAAGHGGLQLVVIIGESFIKSHSSLYGYHLAVNPQLEQERADSALVVFRDMITAGNFTNMSIENMMSLNRLNSSDSSHRDWWRSVYFPLLFKKAGWEVYLFTNQYDPQSRSSDLGRMFFDPFVVEHCYDAYNKSQQPYDGDFVKAVVAENSLGDSSMDADRLTVWHLKGQHFPARNCFPDDSALVRFTIEDIPDDKPWLDDDKRQQVADYANATLYNDSIVASIIDLYRGTDAVVVYFSDHGEEMWDTAPAGNRNKQRPDDAEWMQRQFDIPFVVWMSPSFRSRYPDVAGRIRAAADRPGSLDGLGQMMLDISGIRSKHVRPDESVISDSYRPCERISAQGYAYPD